MKFHIETDHKPLVPLLGSKDLDKLPPRVLRFRLRLARFQYTIEHIPGKYLHTADALSRVPEATTENDTRLQEETEKLVVAFITRLPASKERHDEYSKAQAADPICSTVASDCQNGWPNQSEITPDIKPFWKARGDLTIPDGTLLLYHQRIVVPKVLQRQTLQKIHTGHQGIQRCRLRAKSSAWWPGISKTINDMVKQCSTCLKHFKPRSEPMIPTPLPDYPWQKVSSDLFQLDGVQ